MLYKRTIPLLLVVIAGIVAFAHDYIPHPASDSLRSEVSEGFVILGAFALFVGAYSLLHMHLGRIKRRQQGWGYSIFVFLGAGVMLFLGIWADGRGPLNDPEVGVASSMKWCFSYILVPCTATVFALLAFYIASAAFRTFRAKNFSAALLLVAAIIVMFGRIPISEPIGKWLFGDPLAFAATSEIVMKYPNMAAKRAILFGVSLGTIAQSLRILFGIERSYMGGGD